MLLRFQVTQNEPLAFTRNGRCLICGVETGILGLTETNTGRVIRRLLLP